VIDQGLEMLRRAWRKMRRVTGGLWHIVGRVDVPGRLRALWQGAVTVCDLVTRTLSFHVRNLVWRLTPTGSDVQKSSRARSYPGSRRRDYLVHVPPFHSRQPYMPLVMVLHGCDQNHVDMQAITRFDELADRHGFVVVYPFITGYRGMRLRNCWGWWREQEITRGRGEVEDLWRIVNSVRRSYRIDPDRIHVTGLSSGAAMAVAMAVAHSGKIASCAAVAGVAYAESMWALGRYPKVKSVGATVADMKRAMGPNQRPTPLFIAHSANDHVVGLPAAQKLRDSWIECFGLDRRNAEVTSGEHGDRPWSLTGYATKDGASALAYLVFEGYAHGWYGGASGPYSVPDAPDVSRMIWSFFAEHPRRNASRPALSTGSEWWRSIAS